MRSRSSAAVVAAACLVAVLAVGSARRSWVVWGTHTEDEIAKGQTKRILWKVPLWEAAGKLSEDNPYRRENLVQTGAVVGLAAGVGLVAILVLSPRRRPDVAADYQERTGGAVPDGRAEAPEPPASP